MIFPLRSKYRRIPGTAGLFFASKRLRKHISDWFNWPRGVLFNLSLTNRRLRQVEGLLISPNRGAQVFVSKGFTRNGSAAGCSTREPQQRAVRAVL